MHGHFRSRDKDGGHIIQSTIAQNLIYESHTSTGSMTLITMYL